MNKNGTAYSFAKATEFIQDAELVDRLIKIRLDNPDISSLVIELFSEIYSLKERIGAQRSADVESRFGEQTERTTKFVYLFQDLKEKNKYKIGISKNVIQRSKSVGSRVAILAVGFGGDLLEWKLHQKFREKRIWHNTSREWFVLDKTDVEFVKKCIDKGEIIKMNNLKSSLASNDTQSSLHIR